jgi:hypothetical protein
VVASTSTGNAQKRASNIQHWLAAIVSWQKENNHIHPTTEVADTQRRCIGGTFLENPRKVWEGPSPANTSRQKCPSWRLYRSMWAKLSKAIHARPQRKVQ